MSDSDGVPLLYQRYTDDDSGALDRTRPGAPTFKRTLIGVPVLPRPPADPHDVDAVVVDVEDLARRRW